MNRMTAFLVVAATTVMTTTAFAQNGAAPAIPAASPAAEEGQEQDCCESLRAEVRKLRRQLRTLQGVAQTNADHIDKLIPLLDKVNNVIEPAVTNNTSTLADLVVRVGDNDAKLKAVVAGDNASNFRPNILGKMAELEVFKDEVQRSVQGRILFHNHNASYRRMYVNGSLWNVRPGDSYIWATVGKVLVHKHPAGTTPGTPLEDWHFNETTGNWELHIHLW